ncbi:MAG TPA: ferritin [Ignavibacteria bacterium]|mgnify:FL=1|nr:ferritin [Ignavibacteria bacterium]HMQ99944.1 ferritin [Ignavibacteria bacterium]
MLSGKLQTELNKQMNNEFFAEYEYLSMAAYFHAMNLDGIANYFHVQAQEEHFHAMKIFHFVLDKGGKVELQQIAKPDVTFKSPIEVFEKALGHEKKVTKSINDLMDDAIKENDHAVNSFLKWYVDEQVEEEALASKALGKMELIGGKGEGLLILDQEYASRSFTPPVA